MHAQSQNNRTPNVLVVEDDEQLQKVIGYELEEIGFRYETASNGRIALQRLCENTSSGESFDCMLLDIVMPEIDGWQVLDAVKNNPIWAPMKVIVLTGYANTPADVARVAKYDGVHIEKKGHFVEMLGELLTRLLNE
ncbi:MAG: response regulator [Armatimonadota bacterium]